ALPALAGRRLAGAVDRAPQRDAGGDAGQRREQQDGERAPGAVARGAPERGRRDEHADEQQPPAPDEEADERGEEGERDRLEHQVWPRRQRAEPEASVTRAPGVVECWRLAGSPRSGG